MISHEELQAESMSKRAGIDLNPEQVESYVYARTSLDPDFRCQSDQVLLDLTLNEEQTIQFRQVYRNCF